MPSDGSSPEGTEQDGEIVNAMDHRKSEGSVCLNCGEEMAAIIALGPCPNCGGGVVLKELRD